MLFGSLNGANSSRTEKLWEEYHADGIEEECDDFRDNHVDVPRLRRNFSVESMCVDLADLPSSDLQCNHNKLVEDQSRE